MKKLTELDLQTAIDECADKRFRSHGAWLAGMVKRLNAVLEGRKLIPPAPIRPAPRTIVKTGSSTEPEVPCAS